MDKYDRRGKSQSGPYKEECWLTKLLKFFERVQIGEIWFM